MALDFKIIPQKGQYRHDIKVYQIVTIRYVRFVTISLLCQDIDSVYFKYIRNKNYLYSFKRYLYI